mgnify:CR=1 FL=1
MDLLKHAVASGQSYNEVLQLDLQEANTSNEREQGLINTPANTAMTFPNSTGSFTTKGMNKNLNISKFDNQGNIVQSYRSVPPGIDNLPMGNKVGTVIETPSQYQKGGFVNKYQKPKKEKYPTQKDIDEFHALNASNYRDEALYNQGNALVDQANFLIKHDVDMWRPDVSKYEKRNPLKNCWYDNTCVEAVKKGYEWSGYESGIPEDVYDNKTFLKNYKEYGFEEIESTDTKDLIPGDVLQYYTEARTIDIREFSWLERKIMKFPDGDVLTVEENPFHMGIYVGNGKYFGDGSDDEPLNISNISVDEEGNKKPSFRVFRKTNPTKIKRQYGGFVNKYQEGGFATYDSWEEGAKANPQSEIWQGKPNPYAKFSKPIMSPIDYAIGATTLAPLKFFSWMTALDVAANPFIGLKSIGKKTLKKKITQEIDLTPMANRLDEMNAALEKSLKNAGSKAEKEVALEQWAKNNLDEITEMRKVTDKMPKNIIDSRILKKLNKIDPQGGSQITKTDLIVTKDPKTGEVIKFHGISPTPGKITSSEIEKNLPYNLTNWSKDPGTLWMTAKLPRQPAKVKYGPWKNQKGGFVNKYQGPVQTSEVTEPDQKLYTFTIPATDIVAKRVTDLDDAIKKVVSFEDKKDHRSIAQLLKMTAFMENRYGKDKNAYNRDYTNSMMSIDPIMLNHLFDKPINEKGVKQRHTKTQKKWFKRLEDLGLPTDKVEFQELLRKDDPLAAVVAARMVYAKSPKALPKFGDVDEMFNIYYKDYNRTDKHQSRKKKLNRFESGWENLFPFKIPMKYNLNN